MDVLKLLASFGGSTAIVDGYGNGHSYADVAARIAAIGVDTGNISAPHRPLVVLEADNGVDSICAILAAICGRIVVAPCSPDNQALSGRLCSTFGANYLAAMPGEDTGGGVRLAFAERSRTPIAMHPHLAVMLSTSGSTGSAKCVRLSAANLLANARSIADYLEITPADRGLLSLPVFYSYGLSVVTSHLFAGATVLLPRHSMLEPAFWDYARRCDATSFAGVPHSYELLERIGLAEHAPPGLRAFTQAGGRLPPEKVAVFAGIAERIGARFYVMYGQTEATARMAYLPPARTLQAPGAIGIAIPGGAFSLRDDAGRPVTEPGTIGELVYSGPNVMMGYAEAPADLALPQGPADLATGDLAIRRDDGLYEIRGRLSRFIKIYGNRIALDQVEARLEADGLVVVATGTDDTLLIATDIGAGSGTDACAGIGIGIGAGSGIDRRALIQARVRDHFGITPDRLQIVELEAYPRLPSGKIDYAALKGMIQAPGREQPSGGVAAATGMPRGQTARDGVIAVFRNTFGQPQVDDEASFLSLGGDSLTYVNTAIALEAFVDPLPEGWEAMPLGELAMRAQEQAQEPANAPGAGDTPPGPSTRRNAALANLDTLRGLACLMVVALHVIGEVGTGIGVPPGSPWREIANSLDFVRMPLFTAMAGYFYALLFPSLPPARQFLTRKAETLLLPGVTVSFLTIALHIAHYGRERETALDLLLGYGHLWYLYALFVLFAIVVRFERPRRRGWRSWVLLAACFYPLGIVTRFNEISLLRELPWLVSFFAFGVLLRRHDRLRASLPLAVAAACGAAAFFAWIAAIRLTGAEIPKYAIHVANAASLLAVLALVRLFPRVAPLGWIGAFSFTIYLWHPTTNAAARTLTGALAGALGLSLLPSIKFAIGMVAGTLPAIGIHFAARTAQKRWPWLRLPATAITGT